MPSSTANKRSTQVDVPLAGDKRPVQRSGGPINETASSAPLARHDGSIDIARVRPVSMRLDVYVFAFFLNYGITMDGTSAP